MMQVGALGAGAALAGCVGDDDDVPDDILDDDPDAVDIPDDPDDIDDGEIGEDVHIDGQRLILPWDDHDNPELLHTFWSTGLDHLEMEAYESSWQLFFATFEPNLIGRWWSTAYWPDPGYPEETYPGAYEMIEFEHDRRRHILNEDVYWSDGEPITAWDAAGGWLWWRSVDFDEGRHPADSNPMSGATELVFPEGEDGSIVEWHIHDDQPFAEEWQEWGVDRDIPFQLRWQGRSGSRDGLRHPTHLEPWNRMTQYAYEDYQQAIEEGLLSETRPTLTDDPDYDVQGGGMISEEDHEAWVSGERYVSNGAWTLDERVGTEELILKPNEHHPQYEHINYDEVVLEWNPDDVRMGASLQAGTPQSLDYAEVTMSPEAVDAMPDQYQEVNTPSPMGLSVDLDHSREFGDRNVRAAMMFAMNARDIASNVHPTATAPIIRPGWDMWASEAVLDESWAEDNLVSYEQDLDRATELMKNAEFSRGGDDLWERDGAPIQYPVATDVADVAFEETVVSQLNEFGFDLNTQTFDSATFEDRKSGTEFPEAGEEGYEEYDDSDDIPVEERWIDEEYGGRGDFAVWTRSQGDGWASFYTELENGWWTNGWAHVSQVRRMNMADHEAQERGLQEYFASGWVAAQYQAWEDWFTPVPPIGKPDGEPEPFNPGFTASRVWQGPFERDDPQEDNPYYNPPHDEPHPENEEYYWQKLAWTHNWFLPVLPLVRMQNQHFLNRANWRWPMDTEVDQPPDEYMMEYFGLADCDGIQLAGRGSILGNPHEPKGDAELRSR